ncbi:hypothetical protein [Sphaerochaeta globosa]|uniref:Uncharacterized protein n=1 Tax=Sphaerochaeta globosa (strain ATCC BAA-1886 / DSM 22777 / Buddy) TaxID=158189 RepID=F0RZY5_SPHGB|nr:hypothetical protein [Sphaerochaeta globosa]ADY13883.1 hypothetical protein SpiBuddy_2062 [Sphaerochaeta globosa str. Buddy]
MKQTPEFDKIQQQMKKGVITLDGFLGDDTRNLVDIIASDSLTVRRLKTTCKAISQRMDHFKELGFAGLGEFISVEDRFDVKVDSVRGLLPSPFGGKGMYGKINTTVVNKKTGRTIVYTDLHIHFIAEHCFFEGKGSPFRLEPEDLVQVLEVAEVEE